MGHFIVISYTAVCRGSTPTNPLVKNGASTGRQSLTRSFHSFVRRVRVQPGAVRSCVKGALTPSVAVNDHGRALHSAVPGQPVCRSASLFRRRAGVPPTLRPHTFGHAHWPPDMTRVRASRIPRALCPTAVAPSLSRLPAPQIPVFQGTPCEPSTGNRTAQHIKSLRSPPHASSPGRVPQRPPAGVHGNHARTG